MRLKISPDKGKQFGLFFNSQEIKKKNRGQLMDLSATAQVKTELRPC